MAVRHVTGNVVKIRVSHCHSVGIRRQTHCHVTKNVTKKFALTLGGTITRQKGGIAGAGTAVTSASTAPRPTAPARDGGRGGSVTALGF